jgi:hypothetical protein
MQLPLLNKYKAESLASKITADLRLTREMAITNAAVNNSGFTLKMTGSPQYSRYEIINSKTNEVAASHNIDPNVSCSGGNVFAFGPCGELKAGSSTQITVSANGKSQNISVTPATGTVEMQ